MALLDSLKRLFSTSKDVTAAKAAELKDATASKTAELKDATSVKAAELKEKAAEGIETAKEYTKDVAGKLEGVVAEVKIAAIEASGKAKDLGENLKEKAQVTIEKLDEKAAGLVDKLEEKIRSSADKPKDTVEEPIVANPVVEEVKDKPVEIKKEKAE